MKALTFKETGLCAVTLRCSDNSDSYHRAVVIDLGDNIMHHEWFIRVNKKQAIKLRDWLIRWCKENT